MSPARTPSSQKTRHPALLYVASELVKAFGREPSAAAALGPILAALLVATCSELNSLQVGALGGGHAYEQGAACMTSFLVHSIWLLIN